jgi:hypothetical protein
MKKFFIVISILFCTQIPVAYSLVSNTQTPPVVVSTPNGNTDTTTVQPEQIPAQNKIQPANNIPPKNKIPAKNAIPQTNTIPAPNKIPAPNQIPSTTTVVSPN